MRCISIVILNEVKDLFTSTLCFQILHFIQNDNSTTLIKVVDTQNDKMHKSILCKV